MPSRARCAVALGLLLAWAVAPARGAEPVLIERVLAAVDGVPVLLSDVRLLQALRGVGGDEALEALIDERLMLHEAARTGQVALTPEESEAAYRGLLARVPAATRLASAGLRRLAERQAVIVKYVELRFRPQVRVSDEDLRRAHDEGGGAPEAFEAAAAELRARLERAQLDQKIEAWVADLRAAADVRRVPHPRPASSTSR